MSDYFNSSSRRRGNSVAQERLDAGLPPTPGSRPQNMRPSSIRIRRMPSNNAVPQQRNYRDEEPAELPTGGRRRSMSAPQQVDGHLAPPGDDLTRLRSADDPHMQTITEGQTLPQSPPNAQSSRLRTPDVSRPGTPSTHGGSIDEMPDVEQVATGASSGQQEGGLNRRRRMLRRLKSGAGSQRNGNTGNREEGEEYNSDVMGLLDLVDPEVQTIGTLTNIQNSLFVPDLGGLINRKPTYQLSRRPTSDSTIIPRPRAGTRTSQRPPAERMGTINQAPSDHEDGIEMHSPRRTMSLDSQMSDTHYAVLPHGVSLEGWDEEDIAELDDHVRHLLHSRREGFKRSMQGFRQYLRKPLGLFVTLYAVSVTLFGTAWVFSLIGWIYLGDDPRRNYIINIIDNVLVALFALIGDGMAPFRVVDTYHMCFIAHYHHLTWRLRQEKALPGLVDHNDLPERRVSVGEMEDAVDKEETAEFSVLSPQQQRRLQYHQAKFSKAHTFYKPHETSTHHAFPLRLMIASVVLLDCHSMFQIALGTCTWSIDYHVRPEALTATILSFSLTCNIVAGIIISIGDRRTRKKDVLERVFRQGLTEQAIRHVRKNHTEGEVDVKLDPKAIKSPPEDGSAPPQNIQKLVDPTVLAPSGSH